MERRAVLRGLALLLLTKFICIVRISAAFTSFPSRPGAGVANLSGDSRAISSVMAQQAKDLLTGESPAQAAAGMNVKVSFNLKRDGTVVDSRDKSDPMEFVCGEGLVFPGMDKTVLGMAVGETRHVQLEAEDAFGVRDDAHIMECPADQLPPGCKVGTQLQVRGPDGEDMWVSVKELGDKTATLDLNHPLAGAALKLSVTLLSCETAPELPPFEVETVSPGDEKTFPAKGSHVTVHYAGALADGHSFLSTRDQGEPFKFQIGFGKVIKGLDDGILLMSLGERAVIRVPAVLGFGETGLEGAVPPNSDLVFDVELLNIE